MAAQIPLVDYLVLGDDPHLEAEECDSCGARYFGRRNACARCFGAAFHRTRVASEGTLRTFTIVAHAAAGIPVPFVSGIVDCGDVPVRANVVNVDPTPVAVKLGMKLWLATFVVGADEEGTEAVGFGYEPLG